MEELSYSFNTFYIEKLREDGRWTRYAGAFDSSEHAERYMIALCDGDGFRITQYEPVKVIRS